MQDNQQFSPESDLPLTPAEESLVESRLAALREHPETALSLDEIKARLRSRYNPGNADLGDEIG